MPGPIRQLLRVLASVAVLSLALVFVGSTTASAQGTIPSITSISPTSGPAVGGTSVTITGTNFSGASTVLFGKVSATSFTVNSSTSITAVSPAQPEALHNIYVTNPDGTSLQVAADEFTYLSLTSITSVSPTTGPLTGGTTVTITGTHFTGATKVVFGVVPATSFTVVSDTEITAVSPAQSDGMRHNIYVTSPSGTSPQTPADEFY
jgi:IPT/TIG domain